MMATPIFASLPIDLMSFEKAVLKAAVAATADESQFKRALLDTIERSGMADTTVGFSREQLQFMVNTLPIAIRSSTLAGTRFDSELSRGIADGLAVRFRDALLPK